MQVFVEVLATQNEWDAPYVRYRYHDGRTEERRDHRPPVDPSWVAWTYLPHAVVLINGELSPFDMRRQPGVAVN